MPIKRQAAKKDNFAIQPETTSAMTLKAVFFDMDGVLYDSMPNHASTWKKAFATVGIDYPEASAYENEGRTSKGTIELTYRTHLKREATPEEVHAVQTLKTQLMTQSPAPAPLPGIQPLMAQLREAGIRTLIVTGSKQPSLLNRVKNDFGIDASEMITGNDVTREKPDPQPYLMALERAGIDAHEVIVIENAPLGVRSAKAAGIATIAVNTGILPDSRLLEEGADRVLNGTAPLYEQWAEVAEEVSRKR